MRRFLPSLSHADFCRLQSQLVSALSKNMFQPRAAKNFTDFRFSQFKSGLEEPIGLYFKLTHQSLICWRPNIVDVIWAAPLAEPLPFWIALKTFAHELTTRQPLCDRGAPRILI